MVHDVVVCNSQYVAAGARSLGRLPAGSAQCVAVQNTQIAVPFYKGTSELAQLLSRLTSAACPGIVPLHVVR